MSTDPGYDSLNRYFPGFDAPLCAKGILDLVTKNDTSVIDRAADRAKTAFSSDVLLPYTGISSADDDFLRALSDVKAEQTEADSLHNTPSAIPPYDGAVPKALAKVPDKGAAAGYRPQVISEKEAKKQESDHSITVNTAPDQKRSSAGEESKDPAGQTKNKDVQVGTKNLEEIRNDFPILKEKIHGYPLVFLDNGATTQRPLQVINRLVYYYEHENSNVHRGAHELAARSTDAYEGARQIVADFIHAPNVNDIVFVRGTTEGINLVAQAYVRPLLTPGDEIIVSILEHHANIVPWQLIAEETGAVLRVIPCDDSGQLILSEYEKLFNKRTKFVSCTQVSNVLGTITPIEELIAIAHAHGVPILIDGAQSIAHLPVNVQASDADFFVFSGHKVYGPTGIGAVYGKAELLEKARPYQGGGNMIRDVTFERTIYNPAPNKFEAGTASIADAVGLGAALTYLGNIGIEAVSAHEHELTQYALREMAKIPGLHIVGSATARAGVLSFKLDGHEDADVGKALDAQGIAVRTGHHCAQPVLRRFGLESTVRPVLGLYNSFEDVDALVRGIRSIH